MTAIELQNISKRFPGNSQPAVDNINLKVSEGEILVLLGESGSGKTTIMRLVAGIENPEFGEIKIGDITCVAFVRAAAQALADLLLRLDEDLAVAGEPCGWRDPLKRDRCGC